LRHDCTLEGAAYRIRPAVQSDAPFILSLRTDPLLSRFLHPVSGRVEDQVAWLKAYEEREGDWYWIIEQRDGTPEGTIGLYDLRPDPPHAEWGRWILRQGSQAAVESVLLLYQAAFERIGLAWVFCRTLVENAQVVSFHDSCGLERQRMVNVAVHPEGASGDAVVHRMTRERWAELAPGLQSKAERVARMLERVHG